MAKKSHGTPGAFGGSFYKHEVVRELRAELAKKEIILAALIEHTKIGEAEFKQVVAEYFKRQERALAEQASPNTKSREPEPQGHDSRTR